MTAPVILWFRQDLRLADNGAVAASVAAGPVLPVYVLDDAAPGRWALGGAARWWLHHSLAALGRDLASRGAPLLLLRGEAVALIPRLARQTGAAAVHASRQYEPWARQRDEMVRQALDAQGRRFILHAGALLHDPERVRTGAGGFYSVYAPFARRLLDGGDPPPPLQAPRRITPLPGVLEGLALEALDLLPRPPVPDWSAEFGDHWVPGEAGAAARAKTFAQRGLLAYAERRGTPGMEWGTSGFSPHLRHGEISPTQVWHAALRAAEGDRGVVEGFL
ncbi:MAG TPA: deoxyribodipyrimidine photo-lyase, partial [Acetobacteraceae bacterium]|nr:deoxyribodipyrimidine photo-lyase [Acetobacteraceae bacterium]